VLAKSFLQWDVLNNFRDRPLNYRNLSSNSGNLGACP
jgi:hypothetical protein